jgi:hypothetical protein
MAFCTVIKGNFQVLGIAVLQLAKESTQVLLYFQTNCVVWKYCNQGEDLICRMQTKNLCCKIRSDD